MKDIKKLREERGLSQKELAEKSGIAQSAISYIENKRTNSEIYTIVRLAKALGVTVEYLLEE